MEEIRSSTKFCHYTSLENVRKIVADGRFYLSRYQAMNDQLEAERHTDENARVFSLSMCHSEALNIPLFYLYGGIDGKGCRIQFTDRKLKHLLDHLAVYPVNSRFVCLKRAIDPEDYEVITDWVYYISTDGFCDHAGVQTRYSSIAEAFEALRQQDRHYFIKSPVWKFEKEFRIIVRFRKDIAYERIALGFDVKKSDRGISLMCGPEYSDSEIEEIQKEFGDYGITNIHRSSQYKISMQLLKRNQHLFYASAGK